MTTSNGFRAAALLLVWVCNVAGQFEVEGEVTILVKSPFVLNIKEQTDFGFWSSVPPCKIERQPGKARITAEPGRYVISFEGYRIDWDNRQTIPVLLTQEFQIGNGTGTTPDNPPTPEPDKPDEPPADRPDVAAVQRASQAAMSKLNDPVTAQRLYDAINKLDPRGSLTEIRDGYRKAVADVLLTRERAQQRIAWKDWRIAVSDAIADLPQPLDKATYVAAIRAAMQPLKATVLKALTKKLSMAPPKVLKVKPKPRPVVVSKPAPPVSVSPPVVVRSAPTPAPVYVVPRTLRPLIQPATVACPT